MTRRGRNGLVLAGLGAILAVMIALVAYSPPLYRLFCAATGYGGTTQRATSDTATVSHRTVVVRFDTSVDPHLPWRFAPVQRQVKVKLGESTLVYFSAQNLSDKPLVGHATFNVTPLKAGPYFVKIQCFCFNEERLGAHESVQMPVDFYVDPALASDSTTVDIDTITLSYTFFPSLSPTVAQDLSRFAAVDPSAQPNPAHGRALFQARCGACHASAQNRVGPMLAGVVGRKAGSTPGYAYSPALRDSGIVWTKTNLDRWLAGPRQFVPGVRMPIGIADTAARRDIIAFLAQPSASGSGSGSGSSNGTPPTRTGATN